MKQKHVLVSGAAGFVGAALARGFAELGWQVVGLDRHFSTAPERDAVERIGCDLSDGVPSEVPDVDLVVHAAWVTTDPETLGITPAGYLALNLRPLLSVLEYAGRSRPKDLVFLSSSGVFAPGDGSEGLTDRDRPTGASPYATAKRCAEALLDPALLAPTQVRVVRLGYLYGRGEAASPSRTSTSLVSRWLDAARAGEPLEVRVDDPRREWTLVEDLAPALSRLVTAPPARHPIHLGSPHVYRDTEVASLITAHFPGIRTTTAPVPAAQKPPMVPSRVTALQGFEWTDLAAGIRSLAASEALA